MIRKRLFILCAVLAVFFCGCAGAPSKEAASSEEKETMTSEEVYQTAVSLLCYGEANYRQNKAAKELFEMLRGYRDSEEYLDQIYEVCTALDGRMQTEYIYDEYGHILLERGNPYYGTVGENGEVGGGIDYEYTGGQITREQYPTGDTNVYTYDEEGRLASLTYGYADGSELFYTYAYEMDDEGRIARRTAFLDGNMASEIVNTYQMNEDGTLRVLQTETIPDRSPSEKKRILTFDQDGRLIHIERPEGNVTYEYGYVWMPKHDPDEEFVYEHRIRVAYF